MQLQVVTFGQVAAVSSDGALLASGVRKPLALLGVVAAHEPAGISRDQVQLLLWPESTPDRARQSVSQSLYALRQELGMSPIDGGGTLLRLAPGVTSDLSRFRDAMARGDVDAALAIAQRPFFDGVAFTGCAELDQFVDRRRAEMEGAIVLALRTDARKASPADAEGASRWVRYADRTLLDGASVREAAQALARGNNRVVALRLLRRHAEAVQRDMGMRIDGATQQLINALQVNSAEVPLPPPVRVPGSEPSVPTATSVAATMGRRATDFVPAGRPAATRSRRIVAAAALFGLATTLALWISATSTNAGELTTLSRTSSENAAVNDLYRRANEYLRQGRDGLPEARELLRKAVALDSNFASALARLAETQARMNWYGYDRSRTEMRVARSLIARSRQLAPQQPEPHTALAWWLLADRRAYREASAELDSALIFVPRESEALMTRANISRRIGRWEQSVADYREVLRLDPTSYATNLELGNTLLLMRQYTEAREVLERARVLSPDAVDPAVWLAALALRENGDTAKAARILEQAAPLVNAHYLVARATQSFPELIRVLPRSVFPRVTEFSLRDAFGDTALMHVLRAAHSASPSARASHLDSSSSVLQQRLRGEPTAFAAWRALAEVHLEQGRSRDALDDARRSATLMPSEADAYSAMHSQVVLAQSELRNGLMDSARVRVQRLLRVPSSLSEAVIKTDPAWKLLIVSPRD